MKTLAVILFASLVLAGCGDQCDPNTFAAHCDGNKAVICPQPGPDQIVPNHSSTIDCGSGACVLSGGAAFCALASTPDTPCDGGSSSACDSATSETFCNRGFATSRFTCLSCSANDAGAADCHGGPASTCTANAECAPGLGCSSSGFCEGVDAG